MRRLQNATHLGEAPAPRWPFVVQVHRPGAGVHVHIVRSAFVALNGVPNVIYRILSKLPRRIQAIANALSDTFGEFPRRVGPIPGELPYILGKASRSVYAVG